MDRPKLDQQHFDQIWHVLRSRINRMSRREGRREAARPNVIDHGLTTGRDDDDHSIYLNEARHLALDIDARHPPACPAVTVATISSGAITIDATAFDIRIETEGGGASDDLDTIDNGDVYGQLIMVRAHNGTHTVVLKDGTDNLSLPGDFSLDALHDTALLFYNGSSWLCLSTCNNA